MSPHVISKSALIFHLMHQYKSKYLKKQTSSDFVLVILMIDLTITNQV